MKKLLPALLLALTPLVAHHARADELRDIVFDALERQIIAEYYREHGNARDGARAKRLPHGIAKKLARGKPLPPGIAKRNLPAELEARLPPPPPGHERVIVDGRVLLIDIATGVIRDKLEDVLLKD